MALVAEVGLSDDLDLLKQVTDLVLSHNCVNHADLISLGRVEAWLSGPDWRRQFCQRVDRATARLTSREGG
jgi:hypothetical protein